MKYKLYTASKSAHLRWKILGSCLLYIFQ